VAKRAETGVRVRGPQQGNGGPAEKEQQREVERAAMGAPEDVGPLAHPQQAEGQPGDLDETLLGQSGEVDVARQDDERRRREKKG
jgi:hypothetical protein